MNLQQFADSKASILEKAHTETLEKLSKLPHGEIIAEKYRTLIGNPNIVRYGVLLPLIFEDWLDLSTAKRREMFWKSHIQILCLYALILELDDFQDSKHTKQLVNVSASASIGTIQQSLEKDYNDEQSTYRTEWQNILLSESISLIETQSKLLGFHSKTWVQRFKNAVKKASTTFILETYEDHNPGRLEQKLIIAADKNQMILASAVILAPLAQVNLVDRLYESARSIMLPIQITDDLYDWKIDYKDQRYTTVLRNVPNWDMNEEELYFFLVKNGDFQELISKSIGLIDKVLKPLYGMDTGQITYDLFVTLKEEQQTWLNQLEELLEFCKKKEGGIENGNKSN